jgi:hypothetical protein
MSVYVDDMNASYRRMKMCHMIATDDDELHAMADRIGVARRWHQAPPAHSSHYDICQTKKALAIKAGAIPITWRQAGCMNLRRRVTGELGPPEEAEEWAAAFRRRRREGQAPQDGGHVAPIEATAVKSTGAAAAQMPLF